MAIAPFAHYLPLSGHDGGRAQQHWGAIMHCQQGNGSCFGIFQATVAPNRRSSNMWVPKQGRPEQYLDTDLTSWAQGDGNPDYISIEFEGFITEALTDSQISYGAQILSWHSALTGWPLQLAEKPGDRGFGWHGMGGSAWGGHPDCPGNIRKAQRQAILNLAANHGSASTQPPTVGPAQTFGDEMQRTPIHIPALDESGNGWISTGIPFEKVVSVLVLGPAPQRDGYGWPNTYWSANDTSNMCEIELEGGTPTGSLDLVVWSVS